MSARMLMSIIFTLFISGVEAYPNALSGTWESGASGHTGKASIFIHEFDGNTAIGTLEISGSKECASPFAFRGKVTANKLLIESSDNIVCGYAGKISGEVLADGDGTYKGSFAYTYLLITWLRGTFKLTPHGMNK